MTDGMMSACENGELEADQLREDPLSQLFPFRFLGLGLLFCWDWCLHGETTLLLPDTTESSGSNFTTLIVLAEALTLVIMAAFSRRIGSPARHPVIPGSGCAAGMTGAALIVLASNGMVQGDAGFTLGGLLVGYANAVLLLSWSEVYACMSPGRVFLYGSLSLVFAVGVYFVAEWLASPLSVAVTVAVPFVSFALCHLSSARVGREPLPHGSTVRYTFPWKPVVIMGACGFAAAFVDVALFAQGTTPHILADLIVGCLLLVAVAVLRAPVKPVALVGAAIASVAAGVLSVALFGAASAFAASLLTMVSYVVVTFFTFALLANICRRHGVPTLWLFGCAAAARTVMDHLGGFASLVFPQLPSLADSPLDLAVMAAVGLVAVGAILAVWLSERSFNSNWAVEAVDVRDGSHVPDPHAQLLVRCERVATEHGLTEREGEILVMLVEGRTYQQISSEMLLSGNTVKTHARHMYAKLGVHTREEALALVG